MRPSEVIEKDVGREETVKALFNNHRTRAFDKLLKINKYFNECYEQADPNQKILLETALNLLEENATYRGFQEGLNKGYDLTYHDKLIYKQFTGNER